MSYFTVTFLADLMPGMLTGIYDLDGLYQALPQQLWHLPGSHGRLLQDPGLYVNMIEVNYGVDKLPMLPVD